MDKMAKARAKVVCGVCGKEFWMTKDCANRAAAEKWEEWAQEEARTCPECYAAQKKAEREAEIAAIKAATPAIESGAGIELNELVGSDKQVSWARDIRAGFVAAIEARKIKWADVMASDEPRVKAEVAKLMETSAKWWIDNRAGTIFGLRA